MTKNSNQKISVDFQGFDRKVLLVCHVFSFFAWLFFLTDSSAKCLICRTNWRNTRRRTLRDWLPGTWSWLRYGGSLNKHKENANSHDNELLK